MSSGAERRSSGGPPAWLLCAVLASAGLTTAPASALAQLRGDEVRSVRFEGNRTFPDDSLAAAIVTQQTDCRSRVFSILGFCAVGFPFALRRAPFRERVLPLDRTRLAVYYQRRGFLDVLVDSAEVTRRPGRVDVLWRITEGRPVLASAISYEWLADVDTTRVLEDLPLREGERLSLLARDASRDSLIRRLHNRGYAHADVLYRAFRPVDDPYNAQVTFEVDPGPLTTYGAIEIEGIQELSQGTIRRTLQFNSGDVYRDSDIEQARARLFGLDIVRSATVEPELGDRTDSIAPVRVVVQEGDAYRMRFGGGWSSAECLSVEARWTSRNFLGGARLLQVRGRLGNVLAHGFGDLLCSQSGSGDYADLTWVASVDLQQPWIFSTDNALSTSVFAERQTLPDIFIRRAIGFQAALTRQLGPRTALTFFYRPELSELDADDVLYCSGFLVCTPDDIALLEDANRLAPVGIAYARDRSDDLLNPRSGSRLSIELEHAAPWTGSSFRYDRAVAESTWYGDAGAGIVLAGRLRGGWVGSAAFDLDSAEDQAIVHPQRRFFAGGANSVRGFAQSRLGPRVLIVDPEQLLSTSGAGCTPAAVMDLSCDAGDREGVDFSELPTGGTRVMEANAEVRFPIGSWLEGVAFTDFGQAWGAGDRMSINSIEVTPGFGLRFPSPVGPIRVDLAYGPGGEEELQVIAPRIRAFDAGLDDPGDRLIVDNARVDYVRTGELAPLTNSVLFAKQGSRFQLHVSIGQAF